MGNAIADTRPQLALTLEPRRCTAGHVMSPGNLVRKRARGRDYVRCRICVNAEMRSYMKQLRWALYVERQLARTLEAIAEVEGRGGPRRAAAAISDFRQRLNIRAPTTR